ncbi:MAG: amidohydrolase family protein, partial [Thermodesulfovibrionales bacterium]
MTKVLDIVIKNAFIYDGSGTSPFSASVGIKDKKIIYIGKEHYESAKIIDVDGLALSPGFIDTHGHSEFSILSALECESKIAQGITTEINGNCGLSAAPLIKEAKKRREADIAEFGILERWSDFNEYFAVLEKRRPAINFATLTGHGNIRASVKGYAAGRSTNEEISEMAHLFDRSLASGSFGMSTGLIYPPGVFTGAEELVMLMREADTNRNMVYATHMRSEGDKLIESIKEAITIGKEAGARIHISHLKTGGQENWHKVDDALRVFNSAVGQGVPVTFDRYPYTGASTDLDIMLPSWMYEDGNEQELKRLRASDTRKKIIDHLKAIYKEVNNYESVLVSSVVSEKNRWMEGKSIVYISRELKKTPEDTILDILIEENLRVGAIFMSMSEDNLRKILSHPMCMIGSDSSIRNYSGITAKGK